MHVFNAANEMNVAERIAGKPSPPFPRRGGEGEKSGFFAMLHEAVARARDRSAFP